jgi:hypothetical protein
MNWLTNATLISAVQFLIGLLVTRWPALKKVANDWIPTINTIVGFLVAIFTPSAAHAAADSLATGAAAQAITIPLAFSQGLWQSLVTAFFWDKIAKPIFEKVFHWNKAV